MPVESLNEFIDKKSPYSMGFFNGFRLVVSIDDI